jgi:hypothetical protein
LNRVRKSSNPNERGDMDRREDHQDPRHRPFRRSREEELGREFVQRRASGFEPRAA